MRVVKTYPLDRRNGLDGILTQADFAYRLDARQRIPDGARKGMKDGLSIESNCCGVFSEMQSES